MEGIKKNNMMDYAEQQIQRQKTKEYEESEALKRPERAERIIKFLDKTGAYEFFQNIGQEKDIVTFDQFKSFLQRLNGIASEIPINQREFDGGTVELTGSFLGETVLPPRQEDKEGLLRLAFDSAKTLSADDNSYMLPAVINELHMFKDANGRTSRTLHLLMTCKDKETFEAELRKALDVDGRYDSPDVNPGLIDHEIKIHNLTEKHGWGLGEQGRLAKHIKLKGFIVQTEYGQIDKTNQSYVESVEKFRKIASSDPEYILTAVVESLSQEKYDSILWNDRLISPVKMATLSEQEWNGVFETYHRLKREQVESLVSVFTHPETFRNQYDHEETLRDMFIRKIKEENK